MRHDAIVATNRPEVQISAFPSTGGGAEVSFSWTADIGPKATAADIAAHLADVQTLIDVGARWGLLLAEAQAARDLAQQVEGESAQAAEGAQAAEPIGQVDEASGLSPSLMRDIGQIVSWADALPAHDLGLVRPQYRFSFDWPVPELFGQDVRVDQMSYSNPIHLVLVGGAFLIAGAIVAARFVRDWSARKRITVAAAQTAEAAARGSQAWAGMVEWLVDEVRGGRLTVAPGELAKMVTGPDLAAMGRLADREIRLALPGQSQEGG